MPPERHFPPPPKSAAHTPPQSGAARGMPQTSPYSGPTPPDRPDKLAHRSSLPAAPPPSERAAPRRRAQFAPPEKSPAPSPLPASAAPAASPPHPARIAPPESHEQPGKPISVPDCRSIPAPSSSGSAFGASNPEGPRDQGLKCGWKPKSPAPAAEASMASGLGRDDNPANSSAPPRAQRAPPACVRADPRPGQELTQAPILARPCEIVKPAQLQNERPTSHWL